MLSKKLLEVKDLQTYYFGPKGRVVRAVDGVSMSVGEREVVGLVGESGCGKSATGLSIMRLVPSPPGRIVGGEISYGGIDLASAPEDVVRRIRGKEIAMIFQDPMTSLNPTYTVRWQIAEAIQAHVNISRAEAYHRVVDLLKSVGIPAPEERTREFPHRLSGGMRQRVMIAMALASRLKLLIADEPTTALDVTVQAQILDLLRSLQDQQHMSILIISHDLGLIAEMAHRVVVMYAGQVIEEAPVKDLFLRPGHPYTEALLESIPGRQQPKSRLQVIPGSVPDMVNVPPGCRFAPRCRQVRDECVNNAPELVPVSENHRVRCLLAAKHSVMAEGEANE